MSLHYIIEKKKKSIMCRCGAVFFDGLTKKATEKFENHVEKKKHISRGKWYKLRHTR